MSDVYTSSLNAINASLHSYTSKEDRDAANVYLEQLKTQEICMLTMLQILTTDHPSHNDSNRQLALSILNDWIKVWWNNITTENQLIIRDSILTLLRSVTGTNSGGFRNKLASILANIAERQYPQHWPTFLDDIVNLWSTSTITYIKEICILTLSYVIEDCVDGDFNTSLPTLRRQDILTGIKNSLSILLQVIYDFLSQCAVEVTVRPCNEATRLCVATLNLIGTFCSFAKSTELCCQGRDFTIIITQLLSTSTIQNEAVNVLYEITGQKLDTLQVQNLMQIIYNSPVSSLPQDEENSLTFQRVYAEAVYQLVSSNISCILDQRLVATAGWTDFLGQYFSLMSKLLDQPSRRLAADVISSWVRILKDPAVNQLSWVQELIPFLLRTYMGKTRRLVWDVENECPCNAQEENQADEFDEYSEYTEFRNNFNNQLRSLTDVITDKFPTIAAQFITEQVVVVINSSTDMAAQSQSLGTSPADSLVIRQWETVLVVFGNVCAKLSASDHSNSNSNEMSAAWASVTHAIEAIIQWNVRECNPDPSLCSLLSCQIIKSIVDSAPILRKSSIHLQAALTTLTNIFTSWPQGDTFYIKRMHAASAAIAQLSDLCIDEIFQNIEMATSLVKQLIAWVSSPEVSSDDACSFREALVVLSEKFPESGGRSNILQAALGTLVEDLNTHSTQMFSNPQTLLETIYAEATTNPRTQNTLASLNHSLGSIMLASKRISPPMFPLDVWTHGNTVTSSDLETLLPFTVVWQGILPLLLTISRTLHGVWDPTFRSNVSQTPMGPMYVPSKDLLMQHVLGTAKKDSSTSYGNTGGKNVPELIATDLTVCRQQLYHLLGQACVHKTFYVWSQRQIFLNELPSLVLTMENHHVSMLMSRFVEPFVLNAPPCCYQEVGNFLQVFLSDVLMRLGVAWGPEVSSTGTGGTFEQTVYHSCSIPIFTGTGSSYAGLSVEEIATARCGLVTEVTSAYSSLLAVMGCIRGYLAATTPTPGSANTNANAVPSPIDNKKKTAAALKSTKGGKKNTKHKLPEEFIGPPSIGKKSNQSTEATRQAQKEARRKALKELIMGDINPGLTKSYVLSIVSLLCLPDANACRTSVALSRSLAMQAHTDTRLLSVVGKDCFSAVFSVLVKQEAWSTDLSWDLIDFIQDIYCSIVLGLESDTDRQPLTASPAQQHAAGLVLNVLQQAGVSNEAVNALDVQLNRTKSSKRRREYFKDFLTSLITSLNIPSVTDGTGDAAAGSIFKKNIPKILDIRQRLVKKASTKNKTNIMSTDAHFSLANLFDDDDL
jgi:hypothetical protein